MFARLALLVLLVPPFAHSQVVLYEATSYPEDNGWTYTPFCTPERSIEEGGFLHQHVEIGECGPPPGGDVDRYIRSLSDFEVPCFFLEWRMYTTGNQSEIPGTAPASIVAGSFGLVNYHFTIAKDRVRFILDSALPLVWVDIEPDVFHRYRLELFTDELYVWYIDGHVVDMGVPEAVYPSSGAELAWRAKSWFLESTTMWDYVRYGVPAVEHSGDYDSSSTVELFDFFYFRECIAERGNGPGLPVDPGCEFADMDADGDVDFHDFAHFQRVFTGSE